MAEVHKCCLSSGNTWKYLISLLIEQIETISSYRLTIFIQIYESVKAFQVFSSKALSTFPNLQKSAVFLKAENCRDAFFMYHVSYVSEIILIILTQGYSIMATL